MADLKTGRIRSKPDPRDLKFETYAKDSTVILPARFGHGNSFSDWGMLGNDQYGDCVFAGADHETMLIDNLASPGAKTGFEAAKFTPANALDDYGTVTGFNPQTGAGDNGTEPRAALKYRVKTGLVDATGKRHKIAAYVAVPLTLTTIFEATFIFDAVGIGFEFPGSAMNQFNEGKPWEVVPGAQIEGGHYVPIVGRPEIGKLAVITWAKNQHMSEDFFSKYVDEAWAFITPESLNAKTQKNWGGYDWAQLEADLKTV